MGPSSFEVVRRAVKQGALAPVYYLTGEADLLKDDLVAVIADAALDPATRDFNLDVRSAAGLDGAALQALVETLPVLAARRVVVIKGLEQWRKNAKVWEQLYRYLERPAPTTVLILVLGAGEAPDPRIARAGVHVDLAVPGPEELRDWARERARQAGVELEAAALEHLVRAVGPDLAHLASELDKLAAAATPGQPVTQALVVELVGVRRGETVDDWVEAVISREVERAVALTGPVLQQPGVTGVRLVMALGAHLIGLRLARALADRGSAGQRLEQALSERLRRIRPAWVRDWRRAARLWAGAASRWGASELERALRAAYEADRALKSTTVSDDAAIVHTLVLAVQSLEAAA